MDDLTRASMASALDAVIDKFLERELMEFRSTVHRQAFVEQFGGLVEKLKLQHPGIYERLVVAVRRVTGNLRKHIYAIAKEEGNRQNIDRFTDALHRLVSEDLRVELF